MEANEFPKDISAIDAVADAIMVAYAQQFKKRNYEFYDHGPGNNLGFLLHEATSGGCYDSSVNMLSFLTEKYKGTIDNAFILISHDFNSDTDIGKKGQLFHAYAVILGDDGYWYAASPANHDSTKKNAYALEMIREKSLKSVLKRIRDRDKGSWPTPSEISKLLKSGDYQNPSLDLNSHKLHYFEIEQIHGRVNGVMMDLESKAKIN